MVVAMIGGTMSGNGLPLVETANVATDDLHVAMAALSSIRMVAMVGELDEVTMIDARPSITSDKESTEG
jgi:hypothetical protein